MWHDHPFSQRNMATEEAVGVELNVTEKSRQKFEKKWVRNLAEVFIK